MNAEFQELKKRIERLEAALLRHLPVDEDLTWEMVLEGLRKGDVTRLEEWKRRGNPI